MALQKHFRDAGHGAQAAVNLERRVESPEVCRGAFANETLIRFMCLIALAEAGAAIHAVSQGPSGGSVAAQIQRFAGGLHPFWFRINERSRVERTKMRNVTVSWLADIAVMVLLTVFLNLTIGPDQNRVELGDLLADGIEEGVFVTECLC